MKGDRERCLAQGFDSYLSKPIRSDELFKTIEELAPLAAEVPTAASVETGANILNT